jgi:hypothetical protein
MLPVSLDCFSFVFLRLVYHMLPVSLFCLSSSCVPYVASFSGLFFFVLCTLCCQKQRIHKTKKDNTEKLATHGTQDEEKQRKTSQRNWQTEGTQDEEKQKKNNPEKLAT